VTPREEGPDSGLGSAEINQILERAKAEWEAAFDSISEGIAIVDLDGTVRRVNHALASLLGRDVRNMINISCCDLFAHHRNADKGCPVREYPTGDQGTFEVFFPDYRYYEDSVHPIMRGGTIQGLVIVVKDVTREQMAQQEKRHLFLQMEEAARKRRLAEIALESVRTELDSVEKTATLGRLASIIFAEVNRTMRMVSDGLEMVSSGEAGDEVLDDLSTAASRCARMLDKLSSVRVDDSETVNALHIDRLLREVAAEFAKDLQAADISIDMKLTELPPGEGNVDQIRAVFSSLLSNAIDAARKSGGTVVVQLRREEAFARIEFHDDGQGIESSHLPQIFNPFFTTDPKSHRIGLGLTICQSIIQGHRGHIEVESEPGQGTTVKVLLPIGD
jgi:PAS domain S-box-containing protein